MANLTHEGATFTTLKADEVKFEGQHKFAEVEIEMLKVILVHFYFYLSKFVVDTSVLNFYFHLI